MIIVNLVFCLIELFTLFYLLCHIAEQRFNKYFLFLSLGSLAVLNSLLSIYLPETIVTLVSTLNTLVLVMLLFKNKHMLLLVYSIVYHLITGFVSILSISIISVSTGYTSAELLSNPTIFIIGGFFNKLVLLCICIFIVKSVLRRNRSNQKTLISILILVLFIFICVCLQFFLLLQINNSYIQLLSIFITLILISIFLLILFLSRKYFELEEEKTKLEALNSIKALFNEYKEEIEENQQYLNKIKHDYKNNLNILSDLLNNNHNYEAQKIIESLNKQTNFITKNIWSHNVVLDSIINNQVNKHPTLTFDIRVNSDLSQLNELDVCILFSNLFDNAARASLESSSKLVNIVIEENEFFYIIQIANSINNNILDLTQSTKTDNKGHGYGIKNIENVVSKYKGNSTTSVSSYVFTYRILLSKLVD